MTMKTLARVLVGRDVKLGLSGQTTLGSEAAVETVQRLLPGRNKAQTIVKRNIRDGKMAQQLTVPAALPNNLSLIPETHMTEGED